MSNAANNHEQLVPGAHNFSTNFLVAEDMLRKMDKALEGYSKWGTILRAAEEAGVGRNTVTRWRKEDALGFEARFLDAHEAFCDRQEGIVYSLNEGLKPGQNPLSVLATLNANRPGKWRPNVPITVDIPNETLKALQALQRQDAEGRAKELPEPDPSRVVEGKAKVLPWEE